MDQVTKDKNSIKKKYNYKKLFYKTIFYLFLMIIGSLITVTVIFWSSSEVTSYSVEDDFSIKLNNLNIKKPSDDHDLKQTYDFKCNL
ncbi:hypothetical protein A0H76_1906 [Hepatospora eriocheir]|uniref:Uncharacterized protein n=1 Tax=Hepatospora eriocheir TaxID=1081669 RepID=A0A1X0QGC6_9MICR|nr:hypothetical protein A0H76_1906 [Hepatospora eriocheir]